MATVALRWLLFGLLALFALFYLLPLFVMIVTSLKSLDEIHAGNIIALPQDVTVQPWIDAWATTCVGLRCEGIHDFFLHSVKMVVPAVPLSTMLGSLNGLLGKRSGRDSV